MLSKWTARTPHNRERHFLVTELHRDAEGEVQTIDLQAVLTGRTERLDWHHLEDIERWQMGWK